MRNEGAVKVFALSVALLVSALLNGCAGPDAAVEEPVEQPPFFESSYMAYLSSHGFVPGVTKPVNEEIVINIADFEASADMVAFSVENGVNTGDIGTITWNFTAQTAGFYNLEVAYLPQKGTNSPVNREIRLDGEVLHDGLRQIIFNRSFKDASDEIQVKNNNEMRPRAQEVFAEGRVFVDDSLRRSLDPYLFYISAGDHELTFESAKEPVIITGLRFAPAPVVPSYDEFIAGTRLSRYAGENLVYQAERVGGGTLAVRRSLPSIAVKNRYFDPSIEPFHPWHIVFNTVGAETWRNPGEVMEWDIDVPEEGLYKVSFKGRQGVSRGVISNRSLKINGESPFVQAQALSFPFSAVMMNNIAGGEDSPLLFPFKKGTNTISMEVVLGDFGMSYAEVAESVLALNDLYRRIVQITGTVPEAFIDYEVPRKIPDYVDILEYEEQRLSGVVEALNRITGETGDSTRMVVSFVKQLLGLIERPDNITKELGYFRSNISALATWMMTISEMPLELDSFTLMAENSKPAPAQANFFRRTGNDITRFFATFFVDTTAIDSDVVADNSGDAVTVWISSGRDQAQLLRGLIDERFVPEYGIPINLQLVPLEVVIPSALAGVGPDIALSMSQGSVMDFAMRNALVDMSTLDGFNEEAARYFPSAMEGITFQGKTYGLPETQSFPVMFYRWDILDNLGLKPPKTWEEFREIIPVLQRNNYEAYVPGTALLAPLTIQKGGDIYLGSGNDYGIQSGLLEEPAMLAFKEITDYFTAYKLPVAMDFNNRFRTGEAPIGIADYITYCTLEIFAPEIRGLWTFEALPGTLKADGNIDNRTVSGTSQSVILKAAEERNRLEDAWTFVKWWTSTDIQVEFANGIEAILGTSARYTAASPEVLVRLPWAASDAKKILEQFAATRGIPSVPGYYMQDRMVGYAFNNVVADGANPREVLYLNTKDINSELTKKRKEFGLSYIEDGGF